jgi:hypothetical protein
MISRKQVIRCTALRECNWWCFAVALCDTYLCALLIVVLGVVVKGGNRHGEV